MQRTFALAALFALMACFEAAARDYAYEHNGSRMKVSVNGAEVRIVYQRPRSGLRSVGVRPGTLLFDGRVSNGYLEGKSRVFNANCGEVDYFVYGDFRPGSAFRLSGAAPVVSNMSCRIVDNVNEGPNANLAFTPVSAPRPAPTSKPEPQPRARDGSACVTGVNSTLNVRVGPGADYGRIAELAAGSCGIEVLARCQGDWCAVRQGDVAGWVSMRYVRR